MRGRGSIARSIHAGSTRAETGYHRAVSSDERPSVFSTVVRVIFLVPFVLIGLVAIAGAAVQPKLSLPALAFGAMFFGLGTWQIVAAVRRHRVAHARPMTVVSPGLAAKRPPGTADYRSSAGPEVLSAAELYAPVMLTAPLPVVRSSAGKSLPIALGRSGPRDTWFAVVFSTVWLVLVVPFFAGFLVAEVWLAAAFLSIFVLVGVAVAVTSVRKLLSQLKLPRVEVSEEPVFLGDVLRVNVTQPGRATIARLQVDLVVREIARCTVGTDTRTEIHDVWTTSLLDEAKRTVASGELWANEASVVLPKELPPSFASKNNAISWVLRVRADITHWPDYDETYELRVLPKPAP